MFKRRTYLAVFAAVVMIFILAKQLNEEKAPLTINGDPVSEEELAFHDGSLERTVRSREIWNWAAEGGMADEFSYDDLIQSLENENRERKRLQSEGGVLYGPVEYTPLQYYRRLTGERERMLRTRILEETDSSELIRYYETHQENYMDGTRLKQNIPFGRRDAPHTKEMWFWRQRVCVGYRNRMKSWQNICCSWRKEDSIAGLEKMGKTSCYIVSGEKREESFYLRKWQERLRISTPRNGLNRN